MSRVGQLIGGAKESAMAVSRDRDLQVAVAIMIVSTLVLAWTATTGFVRDEGYYFRAAAEYHGWFEGLWQNLWAGSPLVSFTDNTLTRAFGYNTEHPGLVKIMMGWTWKVFHVWLGWTSHATGYRLASIVVVAVGNGFTYLFGVRLMSRPVGLLAAAMLMLCPHVFYHAHLACFDGPTMATGVIATYAFWRSLKSPAWIFGAGVAWGLAVATKHNALFLPIVFGLAWLLAHLKEFHLTADRRLAIPAIPWAFFSMLLVGPVILYIFYPYGWHAPFERLGAYYSYHLHHEHYPVEYFGSLLTEPPFPVSFPFVMTGFTVPISILVPGTIGLVVWVWRGIGLSLLPWRSMSARSHERLRVWLMVLSVLVPVLVIALPTSPIFGGTKHWMTMMPFFCLLAAWVVVEASEWLRERLSASIRFGRVVTPLVASAVLAMPACETMRTHPLGHTYFNEFAGGHVGGAALGMSRTFWGGDARELLPVLNDQAEKGAAVFCHRMNWDDFRAYQKDGMLRSDLRWVSDVKVASWALINHQREYQDSEYDVWSESGDDRRPVAVVEFDGVPIVSLYRVGAGTR